MSRAEELAGRLRGQYEGKWEPEDWRAISLQTCERAADLLTRYAALERAAIRLRDADDDLETLGCNVVTGECHAEAWTALRAALAELEG